MEPLELLTAVLVLIIAYFVVTTRRMLQAHEDVVEAMRKQAEAFMRPRVRVTHFLAADGIIYLKVNNVGPTLAEHLTLAVDKVFYPRGMNHTRSQRAGLAAFQESISRFAPGAERTFALMEPNAAGAPARFDVTATYAFGEKTFSERTTVDLRPHGGAIRARRALEQQLASVRKELERVAGELETVKQRAGHEQQLVSFKKELERVAGELETVKRDYAQAPLGLRTECAKEEVLGLSEAVKPPPLLEGLTKPRILLVEDNEHTQFLIESLLENEFSVTVVDNAEDALLEAFRTEFDMVLMDINLGDGPNGADVLLELRAMPTYRDVPIVAITAYALLGNRERFLKMGFTAFLPKPFTAEELLALTERF